MRLSAADLVCILMEYPVTVFGNVFSSLPAFQSENPATARPLILLPASNASRSVRHVFAVSRWHPSRHPRGSGAGVRAEHRTRAGSARAHAPVVFRHSHSQRAHALGTHDARHRPRPRARVRGAVRSAGRRQRTRGGPDPRWPGEPPRGRARRRRRRRARRLAPRRLARRGGVPGRARGPGAPRREARVRRPGLGRRGERGGGEREGHAVDRRDGHGPRARHLRLAGRARPQVRAREPNKATNDEPPPFPARPAARAPPGTATSSPPFSRAGRARPSWSCTPNSSWNEKWEPLEISPSAPPPFSPNPPPFSLPPKKNPFTLHKQTAPPWTARAACAPSPSTTSPPP